MTDFTFENYREYFEEHLTDFIPDVDHKSITAARLKKHFHMPVLLSTFIHTL